MKLLATDIGGVCIRLCTDKMLKALGVDAATWQQQLASINHDYSCGRIDSAIFGRLLGEALGKTVDEVHAAWNQQIGDEIERTTHHFYSLWERGWKIVFLSDTQPWHIEYICEQVLPYAKRMDGHIFSFEVGAEKPSPLIYQAFEDKYGKPDLYIDDLPGNIAAASQLGWNAKLYNEQLAEYFQFETSN